VLLGLGAERAEIAERSVIEAAHKRREADERETSPHSHIRYMEIADGAAFLGGDKALQRGRGERACNLEGLDASHCENLTM
jgi:hypothetical protein